MKWVGAAVAAAMLTQWGPAAACGDKLAMMGGGVSFDRVNQRRHRGNVVMLRPADVRSHAGAAEDDLRRALERAGHRVRVMAGVAELDAALGSGTVDVVLIDRVAVPSLPQRELATLTGEKEPIVLALVYAKASADDTRPMADGRCVVRADAQRGHQVLDAIDRLLASRARGERVPCAIAPPTQTT